MISIWAHSEPALPEQSINIAVVETGGQDVEPGGRFLGTALFLDGRYALHVFAVDG